jgi:hypothetical protein
MRRSQRDLSARRSYLRRLAGVDGCSGTDCAKHIAVDQDIRDRIGSAFGPLLEAVDAVLYEANRTQTSATKSSTIFANHAL